MDILHTGLFDMQSDFEKNVQKSAPDYRNPCGLCTAEETSPVYRLSASHLGAESRDGRTGHLPGRARAQKAYLRSLFAPESIASRPFG